MSMKDNNQEVKGAQAVPRVMDTLFALSESASAISVRTIADAIGNSRSSTHRILQSLADSGYAEQRQDGGYQWTAADRTGGARIRCRARTQNGGLDRDRAGARGRRDLLPRHLLAR
jgi:Mn-dependent DtxR family transcriptional regulator